ncbi:MAG: CaiB/BaiF CoA-transferase family protein [Dehalococcoidia bacterium]|nr:CaiB/BaiF CoA-transferase family protein [Dehalococcoidia bacterium]
MQALEGIKVLDLARIGPGTLGTALLGDLGAEVIKVETPPEVKGRQKGLRSALSALGDKQTEDESAYLSTQRNKKSIAINLATPDGQGIIYKLAEWADVVVEAFRPGVAQRLKIDYPTLSAVNPRLIYCSITSYGQTGPYRNFPGHDINFLGIAGVLELIGEKDGPPVAPLNSLAYYTGSLAVNGILAAIIARERTGKGQFIDLSLTDTAMNLLSMLVSRYFQSGTVPKRKGIVFNGAYPYLNVYETKDRRYITIGCIEPWFWENLCRAIGHEDFIPYRYSIEHLYREPEDPKWQEIFACLRQVFLTRTADEWVEQLRKMDIPITKVLTIEETVNDPQIREREMVLELDHPKYGKVKQMGMVIKMSGTPAQVRSFAPALGEHTDEILKGLGYNSKVIGDWRRDGIVY